jgi:hypothetical protein
MERESDLGSFFHVQKPTHWANPLGDHNIGRDGWALLITSAWMG